MAKKHIDKYLLKLKYNDAETHINFNFIKQLLIILKVVLILLILSK